MKILIKYLLFIVTFPFGCDGIAVTLHFKFSKAQSYIRVTTSSPSTEKESWSLISKELRLDFKGGAS